MMTRRQLLVDAAAGLAAASGGAVAQTAGASVAAVAQTAAASGAAGELPPAAPGARRLFLDDAEVAVMRHLRRTMHAPAKKGAVIRPNVARGETALQVRCAPAWDPIARVYRIWMITSASHSGTTYAESDDGLHWRKPPLRQREVAGSLENNIVTPDPVREWPANAMENVVRDPDDPDPSRRYKGFAHCFKREPIASPDGIRWRLLPVPSLVSQDESNLSYDRDGREFLATLKGTGPHGRSVFLATSRDFDTWSAPRLLFHADDLDQRLGRENIARRFADVRMDRPAYRIPETYNVDIYNMGLFRYESVYIGLPTVYHRTGLVPPTWDGFAKWDASPETLAAYRQSGDWAGFHHVQLAVTRDLRLWTRVGDRKPFLDLSPVGSGAYDLATIIGPSSPVPVGDELWFYYTGIKQYGGPPPIRGVDRDHGAICLAALRRDGFVSVDAGPNEGVLETRAFTPAGPALHLNLDAPAGRVVIEALDPGGAVRARSVPVCADGTDVPVAWETGSLAEPGLQPVRLRFRMRRARLYAYWTV